MYRKWTKEQILAVQGNRERSSWNGFVKNKDFMGVIVQLKKKSHGSKNVFFMHCNEKYKLLSFFGLLN